MSPDFPDVADEWMHMETSWNYTGREDFYGSDSPNGPRPPHCWGFGSHSDTPHWVGFLWTSDRPVTETSTWQHTTLTRDRHKCPLRGFEPAIPASERLQIHALDRAATGIGDREVLRGEKILSTTNPKQNGAGSNQVLRRREVND